MIRTEPVFATLRGADFAGFCAVDARDAVVLFVAGSARPRLVAGALSEPVLPSCPNRSRFAVEAFDVEPLARFAGAVALRSF
ncbi:hypothetical protein DB771_09535 [Burkholderia sp. AU29985]|nr:hypothetical protein XM57_01265 [Burkholderia cepacia]AYZ95865.1 hypothetical protein EGY28_11915 [Burkholderia dolosa]ETP61454.1 hypothetical protein BDSB_27305 [Burkholderia dolosa PC543]PRE54420.1 hypothetical protein C6P87_06230 [Burkholderia sp. AU12872]PUA77134.1 hypothetical protein DB771_09535 [Burkholderia sp. AU29985]